MTAPRRYVVTGLLPYRALDVVAAFEAAGGTILDQTPGRALLVRGTEEAVREASEKFPALTVSPQRSYKLE
jgi:hypothetical protein